MPAVVFVGPYAIRGTILSDSTDLNNTLPVFTMFAMTHAVIDCLAPGSRLTGLAAPYLLVRTLLLQGIVLNS